MKTSELLKTHTRSNHQELEKILVGKMRNIHNKQQYIELLQLFYDYFGAIEKQINPFIGVVQLEDYSQRRKTTALKNDIIKLGGNVRNDIEADDLPEYDNSLQAFGALYVIEGSTLGGPHICKMIKKQLDQQDDVGFSFFNGYGDQTEAMWNKFKVVLDDQAEDEMEQSFILASADQTFLKFRTWIQKQAILK